MASCYFKVESNSDFGRYLVSTEDFEQGDVIWEEEPLVSVPCEFSDDNTTSEVFPFPCITCCKILTEENMKCERCGWRCCSSLCSQNEKHKNYECDVFAKNGIGESSFAFKNVAFLRIALFKWKNPEKYERYLNLTAEYPDGISSSQGALKEKHTTVLSFLIDKCKVELTPAEVSTILAILQLNNFKFYFRTNGIIEFAGKAVYDKGSMFCHSCVPNVEFSFVKSGEGGEISWNIRFYCRQKILRGDMLTIAYKSTCLQLGTMPRQLELKQGLRFTCKCSRCLDATEANTYFSAITCPQCKQGSMLQEDTILTKAKPWKCTDCNYQKDSSWVTMVIEELCQRPLSLRLLPATPDSLAFADHFIDTHGGITLHQNHYLLFLCGMHWLMRSNFTPALLSHSEKSEIIFKKIVTRVERFLPLAMKFLPCERIANFEFVIAKILAIYFFHSTDMKTIAQHDLPCRDNVAFCRRILKHLKSSLAWLKMNLMDSMQPMYVARVEGVISTWSSHLENFIAESNQLQEIALDEKP